MYVWCIFVFLIKLLPSKYMAKNKNSMQRVDVPNSLFLSQGSLASGHDILWVLFGPGNFHSRIKSALYHKFQNAKKVF